MLGHFWSESFGQIYPTLARLEREGLVDQGVGDGATYSITAAGLDRLHERLAESIQDAPPRSGLMLRLFFGRHLGTDACRALIEQARTDAANRLVELDAVRAEIAAETETEADQPFWLLTITAGEHSARATLAWADEALAQLDAIEIT